MVDDSKEIQYLLSQGLYEINQATPTGVALNRRSIPVPLNVARFMLGGAVTCTVALSLVVSRTQPYAGEAPPAVPTPYRFVQKAFRTEEVNDNQSDPIPSSRLLKK